MLKVIYRLTSIPSSNPSPVFWHDKDKLNQLCLESFVNAFDSVDPFVHFIFDNCPAYYKEMVEHIVPFHKNHKFTNVGVHENARQQYDFVLPDSHDYLFQECDYLYTNSKEIGNQMLEAIKECDFISPYDHPDKYPNEVSQIKVIANHHWKSTISTTSTFMARGEMVNKELELFKSFGWEDHTRWVALKEKGYTLWTPIPGFATHCVSDYLSPGIDWNF
jgi:hypothetical protein